jgi:CHASE3 domain sensor protein
MKNKKLFLILGIFILLIFLVIGLILWQNNNNAKKFNNADINKTLPMESYEPINRDLESPVEELSADLLRKSLNLIE